MLMQPADASREKLVRRPFTQVANILLLAATLLILATIALLIWFQLSSARRADTWVSHSYEVAGAVNELGAALRDAETRERGYLLTGSDRHLMRFNQAREQSTLFQAQLQHLTADNPVQQERLRALGPVVQQRLDDLAVTIRLYRISGPEAALAAARSDAGQFLMEQARVLLAEMMDEEDRLMASRQQSLATAQSAVRLLSMVGTAIAILMLALSFRMVHQGRRRLEIAEAAQRRLADQMRTALDSISQGIGVFGPDNRLLRWNECFGILLGLPPQTLRPGLSYASLAQMSEVEGKGQLLAIGDELLPGQSGRAADEPVVLERTRRPDERSFELRWTATPDNGFVQTISDITERVRAEATVRETQRLQAVGQLTGGIAHDFNNLLTVIMGNLELLRPQIEPGSSQLAKVDRAIWGVRRGASLTQQLLAFARKQPLIPVPINLSAMLLDIGNLLHRTLGEHIAIRVVDAADLWPAMADPAQVESALLNLALNARDAMPDGGHLTIEIANEVLDAGYAARHAEVTPGDYVMLAVSDTGAGMTDEVLARAFEPFFTTKEPGKGTGLGLPMVFGFVKQSGGHIKIYSEPNEGTTVRLYLPRAAATAPLAPQRTSAPADLPQGHATILVVEDEAAVRDVTVTVLQELGYQVLEAADGPEALRVLEQQQAGVDLLLCDIVLPGGMKGNEVSRRLTEIRPALRTLFMSGYTENAIVHHGRLDDGVQLIGKPFSRERLAYKVAEVLADPA